MQKISKDLLEIINSLSWLFMDAMWMLNELNWSYAFITPTLVSGSLLVLKEKDFGTLLVAFAALMWSVMNSMWLLGETMGLGHYLLFCKVCFVVGVSSLILGLILSKDLATTLRSFKRLRIKKS